MFDISKIRPKSILGPVKAQKFSWCLEKYYSTTISPRENELNWLQAIPITNKI